MQIGRTERVMPKSKDPGPKTCKAEMRKAPSPYPLPEGEGTNAQRRLAIAAEHWQLAEGLEVQLQGVAQQVGDRPEAA